LIKDENTVVSGQCGGYFFSKTLSGVPSLRLLCLPGFESCDLLPNPGSGQEDDLRGGRRPSSIRGGIWAKGAIKGRLLPPIQWRAGLHALALTQHLAMELVEYKVRVNAVSPTVVETPIYEVFINPDELHQALQGYQ